MGVLPNGTKREGDTPEIGVLLACRMRHERESHERERHERETKREGDTREIGGILTPEAS